MLFHFCLDFVDVGSAQFFMESFIIWEFGRKFCDLEVQGLDIYVFDAQFIEAVLIGW